MNNKSSSITNNALERLFGNDTTENNSPNVFMPQTTQLEKLFGDVPLSSNSLSDIGMSATESTYQLPQNSPVATTFVQPVLNFNNVEPETNIVPSLQTSKNTVYHVMVDSSCTLDLNEIKPYTHGRLRSFNKEVNRIPVTMSLDDAENIAKKIATEINKRGSSSTNIYPIFGLVILQIELDNLPLHNADIYKNNAQRDYGMLRDHVDKLLVTYNAGNVNRGLLHPNALKNAHISHIKYVITFPQMDEHTGFAMLNMLKLKHTTIYQMKHAYKAGLMDQLHKLNVSQPVNSPYVPQSQPMSSQNLTGGSEIDYKQLYLEEKATYLKLKALKNKKI